MSGLRIRIRWDKKIVGACSSNIRMAEQAGADISTIYGDDIPQQIAEFARISGITKIVLGSSSVHRRHFWSGPSLTEN